MEIKRNYASTIDSFEMKRTIRNSGDNFFSVKRMNYNIGNYEVKILLDDINRFLGIESIRVLKEFYDSKELPSAISRSAEEIVDEYFRNADE